MKSIDEYEYRACITIFLLSFALVVGLLMDGLVVYKFWSWFIVTVFDLPNLLYWQAVGISLIVSYMTYHHTEDDTATTVQIASRTFFHALFYPLIMLGLGAIVYQFVK